MNEQEWLDVATAKIRFRPDRKAVRRELAAHLEDRREASGLEEDAMQCDSRGWGIYDPH